jgi:hypothetical protein
MMCSTSELQMVVYQEDLKNLVDNYVLHVHN